MKSRSRWLLWNIIPGLHWVSWIHAAVRSKNRNLLLYSLGYGIPFFLLVVFDPERGTFLENLIMSGVMLSWIGSIIHGLWLKEKVAQQIDAASDNGGRYVPHQITIQTAASVSHPAPPIPRRTTTTTPPPPSAEPLELKLMKYAAENSGKITIAKAAIHLNVPTDIITQELERLCQKNIAQEDIDIETNQRYFLFPGLLN